MIVQTLEHNFPLSLKKNFDITQLSSYKIPATVDYFLTVNNYEDLIKAYSICIDNNFPVYVIGGGTNIAFIKNHIHGLIIKNNVMHFTIYGENIYKKRTEYINGRKVELLDNECLVKVSSGYPTTLFAQKMIEKKLSGIEYQIGLPGTIGGAIAMNSKWTNPLQYIGDSLVHAEVLSTDTLVYDRMHDYFNFSYDYSIIKDTHEIILDATFKFVVSNDPEFFNKVNTVKNYRLNTQPKGVSSVGCFFQNITTEEMQKNNLHTQSTGYLIDSCGLKGYSVGKFRVSPIHANFIEHLGNGDGKDLRKLIEIIYDSVYKKYDIKIKYEVIPIP